MRLLKDILNAFIASNPETLYPVPYEYNVQVGLKSSLSEEHVHHAQVGNPFMIEEFALYLKRLLSSPWEFQIIHWNNKNKSLNVYPELVKLRDSLEDMDGSVFEQTRYSCNHHIHARILDNLALSVVLGSFVEQRDSG